jgi:aminoglycoside phosphotransferase (APT) family kinase protein
MEELDRGRFARPERAGAEIRRSGQGSSGTQALLEHYATVGCELTPRFLGRTADGRERLSYLPGETGYPPLRDALRTDEALANVARAIRRVHDASLPLPEAAAAGLVWAPNELARPAAPDIIGHHDLAPWNIVFDGTEVVGIIDWDSAGPTTRVWDLAYAAHQFVPLHPSRDLAAFGWTEEPDRRHRLRLFAAAYGEGVSVEQLVDNAILRIASLGAEIAQQVAKRNPLFAVHAEESHASGYFRAVAELAAMREGLIADVS